MQLGTKHEYFLILVMAVSNFYTSQWEEYHTHVMKTNFYGLFGVTERKLFLLLTLTIVQIMVYSMIVASIWFPLSTITLGEFYPQIMLEPLVMLT